MLKADKLINMRILTPLNAVTDASDSPLGSVFQRETILFLDDLSKKLLANPGTKSYSDVAALAFWLRKGNITEIKKQFETSYSNRMLLARGLVFHIAPSNVDTIFMYSLALSLLAGNTNIVRISEKRSARTTLIISELNRLLELKNFEQFKRKIHIVSYGHDDKITGYFSSICDVRVIWGGNETINHIRKLPLKPRAYDITFADRYSFAVINAEALLGEKNLQRLCERFYNDCYTFDQNACSSPRLVAWLGTPDDVGKAKKVFWDMFEKNVKENYQVQPANAVEKLMTSYRLAIKKHDVIIEKAQSNIFTRVGIKKPDDAVHQVRCPGGYFIECTIGSIDELMEYITQDDQTMTVYGIDKQNIREFITKLKPKGIDRVVEFGHSLDFSAIWDGYDLIRQMSREISI